MVKSKSKSHGSCIPTTTNIVPPNVILCSGLVWMHCTVCTGRKSEQQTGYVGYGLN